MEASQPPRSAVLRRKHRRVFRWSLGLAVLIHVALLYFGLWRRPGAGTGPDTELAEGTSPVFGGLAVTVHFGPPGIVDETRAIAQEPPWRVLSASRILPPPYGCVSHDWLEPGFAKGEVRLSVGETGRPDEVVVARSTGDPCWDGVMQGLARDLRYRWLPNERFAAPVDVFQPVTLTLTGY